MKDTLITFETAKLAKEKGFDWSVSWYATHKRKAPTNPDSFYPELSTFKNWNNNEDLNFYDRYSTPTQSLLQKWLREEHSLFISVTTYSIECNRVNLIIDNDIKYASEYKTYEEALEKGLKEALKLIK